MTDFKKSGAANTRNKNIKDMAKRTEICMKP